jgi:formyltetrahydrofolate-dependent phosphoribosylglycinamide formyltransferase
VTVADLRVAVLASGGGSNLQALLDAARDPEAGFRVVLVISNRPQAGALARAERAGVRTATIGADGRDAAGLVALLREARAGLVVLAGYLKLVPPEVTAVFAGRMINIHPAPLPAFGGPGMYGRRVHEAVLASGARLSGPTVHLVDERYDHGQILAQWPVPVEPGDDPDTLAARVLEAEHRLLPAVVREWARNTDAPGHRGTGAPEYRGTGAPGHRGTDAPGHQGTDAHLRGDI